MLKWILSIVGVLIICIAAFYFIGSAPNLPVSEYNQLKKYSTPSGTNRFDTISVMTYNIGYLSGMTNNLPVSRSEQLFQENLEKAKDLLTNLSPDIIGFQEIDFNSSRSYKMNQLDSLAIVADYSYAFQSVNWDKKYVPFPYWPFTEHFGKIISGQAILSRHSIQMDTTVLLTRPMNSSFIYKAFYLDRLLQVCTIDVNGRKVKVMSLHLEAFDEETRVEQAKTIKVFYEKFADKMPVLLIGDFNSRPATEEHFNGAMIELGKLENIRSAIPDSEYAQAPEKYYTFSSGDPYQMIDYIFYNPNFIKKIEARVVHEAGEISDHLPVLMKFIINE